MAEKEVVKVLKDARKLIEEGWTQGQDARNAQGKAVSSTSRSAVKFCAWGAIDRSGWPVYQRRAAAREVLRRAIERITHRKTPDITAYNDYPRRNKSQVLKAFDLAIKLAEKE